MLCSFSERNSLSEGALKSGAKNPPHMSQFSLFASDHKKKSMTICFLLIFFFAGPLTHNMVYYSVYFPGLSKITKALKHCHFETSNCRNGLS